MLEGNAHGSTQGGVGGPSAVAITLTAITRIVVHDDVFVAIRSHESMAVNGSADEQGGSDE